MSPKFKTLFVAFVLSASTLLQANTHSSYQLKPGDRLAILDDSITERKGYSVFLETYLIACAPKNDVVMMQFGWSGETATGFTYRMEKDLMPWEPTVATICYGKNDGRYREYEDVLGAMYDESMRKIVSRLNQADASVIIGSPGVMDTYYYKAFSAEKYNESLLRLGEIGQGIAEEFKQPFADVNTIMLEAMQQSKAALGPEYNVMGGRDSVHPYANGHLIQAYAFLKALGMDGNIGTILVDWQGDSEATEGHELLSVSGGVIDVKSTRYPFCFKSQEDGVKQSEETASILPFLPFQQDLNRYILVVKNLPTQQASVNWGTETKTFSREQLAAGINLASEFLDNPMCAPFEAVERAVMAKQRLETGTGSGVRKYFSYFKKYLNDESETLQALEVLEASRLATEKIKRPDSPDYKLKRKYLDSHAKIPDRYRVYEEELHKLRNKDPELVNALAVLRPQFLAAQEKLSAKVRTAVKPVTHTITIEPVL